MVKHQEVKIQELSSEVSFSAAHGKSCDSNRLLFPPRGRVSGHAFAIRDSHFPAIGDSDFRDRRDALKAMRGVLWSQVPVGSIPRSITALLVEDQTRKCLPGDSITVQGVFVPHSTLKGGIILFVSAFGTFRASAAKPSLISTPGDRFRMDFLDLHLNYVPDRS